MPRYGTEKIYLDIKDQLIEKNIKMGRDKTLKFCRENNLLVPKPKGTSLLQTPITIMKNQKTLSKT